MTDDLTDRLIDRLVRTARNELLALAGSESDIEALRARIEMEPPAQQRSLSRWLLAWCLFASHRVRQGSVYDSDFMASTRLFVPYFLDDATEEVPEEISRIPGDLLHYVLLLAQNQAEKILHRAIANYDLEEFWRADRLWSRIREAEGPDPTTFVKASNNLLLAILPLFERTGDARLAARAQEITERAVAVTPIDYPDPGNIPSILANLLSMKVRFTQDPEDLKSFVDAAALAVQRTPASSQHLPARLRHCREALRVKIGWSGTAADVQDLVAVARRIVRLGTADASDYVSLALIVKMTIESPTADDAGTWADVAEYALAAVTADLPDDPLDRAGVLTAIGTVLSDCFEAGATVAELDKAIALHDQATALCMGGLPNLRAICLNNLANCLRLRHETFGGVEVLQRAITVGREARDLVISNDTVRAAVANNLANALLRWAGIGGGPTALEEAVTLAQEAADAVGSVAPQRGIVLTTLGNVLRLRSQFRRDGEGLVEAITILREAAHAASDVVGRGAALRNLAIALDVRWQRTGARKDIEAFVGVAREVIRLTPSNSPELGRSLTILRNAIRAEFDETVDDKREHRNYQQNINLMGGLDPALVLMSQMEYDSARRRANLARLPELLDTSRSAVRATAPDDPTRAVRMVKLGEDLLLQGELLESEEAREEGIAMLRDAVGALGPADANAAPARGGLAQALASRATAEDQVEALQLYRDALLLDDFPSLDRISAALRAAELAMRGGRNEADEFIDIAVRLFEEALPHELLQTDLANILEEISGAASWAAELLLERPGGPTQADELRALTLIEQSRAVLLGRQLDERAGLSALRNADPDLAAKYEDVRDLIRMPELQRADRERAMAALRSITRLVRDLDGLGGFMRPVPVAELLAQAAAGPIVVLMCFRRPHALIVRPDGVTACHFPRLQIKDLDERMRTFLNALDLIEMSEIWQYRLESEQAILDTLEWLWIEIVEPILDALPEAEGGVPIVRWSLSGPLKAFPIHAAGKVGADSVMNRVVSAYIPSIGALKHARESVRVTTISRATLVAMPDTPGGLRPLASARDEVTAIRTTLAAAGVDIDASSYLVGEDATVPRVTAALAHSQLAHFACHSRGAADPWAASLLLHDHETEPLTVRRVADADLGHVQLVNLAACDTAVDWIPIPDESLAVATGFLLAGIPRVLATRWQADDESTAVLAAAFYAGLTNADKTIDPSQAARALHQAQLALRDEYPRAPSIWAPFIYMGA